MKNYYAEALEEIIKIKDEKPLVALVKLDEELSLPYIPKEYEQKFKDLQDDIRDRIVKNDVKTNLSKEKIIEILKQPNHTLVGLALTQLRDLHLANIISDIQALFYDPSIQRVMKTIIYEYLVEQRVNHVFIINKKVVNPTIEGSISTQHGFIKMIDSIRMSTFKNPSLQKVAVQNFENIALKIFPPHLPYSETMIRVIIALSAEMLGVPTDIFLDEKELQTKQAYLEIITKIK